MEENTGNLRDVQVQKSVPNVEDLVEVDGPVSRLKAKPMPKKGDKTVAPDTLSIKTTALEDRGVWSSHLEFLLISLGNVVGLGNIWRFPYLVYKYGGGAFLIPYVVSLLVVGAPVLLVETALGQYSQLGPAHLYRSIMPIASGLGFAQVMTTFLFSITYNVIIAWIIYYFFMSFSGEIGKCGSWASSNCVEIFANKSLTNTTSNNSVAAADEFFNRYMLNRGQSIEHWSWPSPGLTLCILFGSFAVGFMVLYGTSTSGKVSYFTSTAPYVTLAILLVRALMLEGSWGGIMFYLKPSLTQIFNFSVWREAISQVIFSLGIGLAMITLGSYNRFHNRVVSDVIFLAFGDLFSSLFAGLVVFSMLGFVAHRLQKDIEQTVTEGYSLVFVVLVEGIVNTTFGPIWVMLFTFTLFFLAISSMLGQVEAVVTCSYDMIREKGGKPNKPLIAMTVSLAFVLVCLPLVTSAGIFLFTVLDTYTNALPLVVTAIYECIVLNIYGTNKFLDDLQYMTGFKSTGWFRIAFQISMIVAPLFMTVLVVLEIYTLTIATIDRKLGGNYYPVWSFFLGWFVAFLPISVILAGIPVSLFKARGKPYSVLITHNEDFRSKAKKYGSYADRFPR